MTASLPRRSLAAVAVAALCLFAVPGGAFGHAELDTMTPKDNSTVPPPSEIVATFIEALDPSGSNLKLADANGSIVAQDSTVVGDGEPKTMKLTVSVLSPGTYTVRWTSKSAEDGDLDRGTTTFTVVAASPSPSIEPSATPVPSAAASASAPASVAPSPSPSGGTGTTTSSTDVLIPIIVVLAVVVGLGAWLLRGRGRRAA